MTTPAAFEPRPTPVTEVELFSVAGADGYLRQVNTRFAELLGVDADRLEDRSILELVHPDDLPEVVAGLSALASGHPEVLVENRFRARDGSWTHLQWVARPLPDSDLWWAAGRDTTPFHRLRARGEDLQARLDLAVGTAAVAWELDLTSDRISWEPQATAMFAVEPKALPGSVTALAATCHPDDSALVRSALDELARTGATDVDARLVAADRHVTLRGRVVERDRRSRPVRAVGLLLDVTTTKAMEEQLLRMVMSDALTGAPNRRSFDQALRAAWRQSSASGQPLSVLMIDIDNFKKLNDTYGHLVGDQVLTTVWRALSGNLQRADDTIARFGGEEFAAALLGADAETATAVADRLCGAVRDTEIRQAPGWRLSVSIGTATRQLDTAVSKPGDLLARADQALYAAKSEGKDRAVAFEAALAGRASLEQAIRDGLARDEFEMHYQPVVSARSGEVLSFEALMRWDRRDHGLVGPDVFIPVAEQSDLIVDLGRLALRLSTQQAADWSCASAEGANGVEFTGRVAVNLSERHVASSSVVDDVASALSDSGLGPERLTIELTETALTNSAVVARHLASLRALGVTVAIDDFGTGYTSVGQLPHVPADSLKVDRSFIASAEPRDRELVKLMIGAAHAFDLTVIGEGVESSELLDDLRALGCDQVQGYLISRPLPAPAVLGWLDSYRQRHLHPETR